jgi:aerobic carbon-monoxide dehydrogenase medium subunit
VKPARFDYIRPDNIAQALSVLAEHGANAAILAGGQSLVPMLNLRLAQPALLIDIKRIRDLAGIACTDHGLVVGAATCHNEVLRSSLVRENAPLLVLALRHVAHEAIRNRGTLGGSLALADPSAELPACAVCLGAQITAASVRGERTIAAEDFFEGLYATALAPDELIVRVHVPTHGDGWRFAFDEVTRRHGDFAIAGVAIALQTASGKTADCRIVFFGVESAPKRVRRAEAALIGTCLSEQARTRACAALDDDLAPIASGEYSPAYRRRLASVLLGRALHQICEGQHGHS